MVNQFKILGFILLFSTLLGACVPIEKTTPKVTEQIEDSQTLVAIGEDTDDAALTHELQRLDSEFERLLQDLGKRYNLPAQKLATLQETQVLLERFKREKASAIRSKYKEYTIDFVEINRWRLRTESLASLTAINWQKYCKQDRTIIIYGYGDPTGARLETEKVSAGRAREIANWIITHTACKATQIIDRGLGIDVKAEVLAKTGLSEEQRQQLFRRSRYARIFVPIEID